MSRARHPELATALVAHGVGYALSLWIAFLNAPRTSELGTHPVDAIARGLAADGLVEWWQRTGARFALGAFALFVLTSVFGSAARLAVTRAGVYRVGPSAAFTHALTVLPRALLARCIVLLGCGVLMLIAVAPLGIIGALWRAPVNVHMHDLTLLGLCILPIITLFVAHMLDDLVHVTLIVHGPRVLEAVMLAVRALHRRAVYGALGAALFVIGVRVLVTQLAFASSSGLVVSASSFALLGAAAIVRAKLLVHYARETQRFR